MMQRAGGGMDPWADDSDDDGSEGGGDGGEEEVASWEPLGPPSRSSSRFTFAPGSVGAVGGIGASVGSLGWSDLEPRPGSLRAEARHPGSPPSAPFALLPRARAQHAHRTHGKTHTRARARALMAHLPCSRGLCAL